MYSFSYDAIDSFKEKAYEQLFLDAEKYRSIQQALADRLYRELHKGK